MWSFVVAALRKECNTKSESGSCTAKPGRRILDVFAVGSPAYRLARSEPASMGGCGPHGWFGGALLFSYAHLFPFAPPGSLEVPWGLRCGEWARLRLWAADL